MSTIVFFLEEPSAREMLEGVLPRLLSEQIVIRYVVFQGKQDLEKNLAFKLRGWKTPDSHFVVLRDQDAGDCKIIKARLAELCKKGNRPESLVRVACRELESWYLADLAAVEKGLEIKDKKLSKHQNKARFRNPDILHSPARELTILTKDVYQKISGSRRIGPHLDLENDRSKSFSVFIKGLCCLVESP